MMQRQIVAVIFDLDGLLVDSEPVQYAAWDAFVARYDRVLTDDLKRRMYGTRLTDSAEMVARELALPITARQVAAERDAIFFDMIPGNIRAKPGALELIDTLRSGSIPIALATSGHAEYVERATASAGIPRQFAVEVTGDQVERGKPHPETYLVAARLLGVQPEQALALEDSPQGVSAAVAAGMVCFAVPDAPAERAVDLSAAHTIVPSLHGVLQAAADYGLEFSNSSHG